jgi:S1-C subfamily serine protease
VKRAITFTETGDHDGVKRAITNERNSQLVAIYRLDGSVNHGNSGGALLSHGSGPTRLLGVVNAKLGGISKNLTDALANPVQGYIGNGGPNVLEIQRQVIREMDQNLQLGIGLAIRANEVRAFLGKSGVLVP